MNFDNNGDLTPRPTAQLPNSSRVHTVAFERVAERVQKRCGKGGPVEGCPCPFCRSLRPTTNT